jgi:molybdate transport system substrate-binding protein
MQFAASGLLRERSEQGAKVDVFASADGGHPSKLAAAGYAKGRIAIFARNELCALAPKVSRSQRMACSRPCSTHRCGLLPRRPRRTPWGDYAFALFAKADAITAGAPSLLEAKALQLTRAPTSEHAPAGKNPYGWLNIEWAGRRVSHLLYQRRAGPAGCP